MTHSLEDHARQPADAGGAKDSFRPSDGAGAAPCSNHLELLEAASDCVATIDAEWRFTYLNRAAIEEIAGGRDLVGVSLWEAFPDLIGTNADEQFRRAMDERTQVAYEIYFPPLQGWFEATVSPLSDGGIVSWFRPINDRKAGEQALADVGERYRLAAKATNDLVWDWDLSTDRVTWNVGSVERFGYRGHELGTTGVWWGSRLHPDDQRAISRQLNACINGDSNHFVAEYRFLKPDQTYADVYDRGFVIRDEQGQAVRMVGAMQDNTLRNRALNELREQKAHLATVFGQAMVGILHFSADGEVLMVNERFCEILGRTEEELRADARDPVGGVPWKDTIAERYFAIGKPYQLERSYQRPDGSIARCELSVSFVLDDSGRSASCILVVQDVTARKEAEDALASQSTALRESEMLYRSVLEASADCIKIIDLDGRLQLMNSSGLAAMELESFEQICGREWSDLWPRDVRKLVHAAVAEAREGKIARFMGMCPTTQGTPKWWDVLVSPMCDDDGRVVRLLSISRDVSAERETAERLKFASEHDDLTALPNRSSFQMRLHAATLRAMESSGMLGLLLIDLDHFKHVNDALGHAAGDHLLAEFGQRLKECVRAGDFVARLGGDEFAVILENVDSDEDLLRAGNSILSRMKSPVWFNGRVMSAGASIGGALFPRDAECAQELFNGADTALSVLKESGRGGTKLFHPKMRQQAQNAASQLTLAREALSETSVVPHYQKKVCLKSGEVVGHEALLRWRHPRLGVQLPETVAEAFKDYELASRIGELMHRAVLADMRDWLKQGRSLGPVAINAAPAEFLRDDFAERLLARMRVFEVPPQLIEIEVTEHVFFDRSSDFVSRALKVLKGAGVRIALDDFGTGYSSLSHLRDFPVDVVKIDRSFVSRMADEPEISAIVSAVISLATTLKIDVVAEGVETEQQRSQLRLMGCTIGQGFLFGRAVDADEVEHPAAAPKPLLTRDGKRASGF